MIARRSAWPTRAAWFVVVAAFVGGTAVPLIAVVSQARTAGGDALIAEVVSWRIGRILVTSVGQALVATALALVVGTIAGWCHVRLDFRGRSLVWAASVIPFVMPAIVIAAGVRSLVAGEVSWTVIVLTHASMNVVVVMRAVAARLSSVDPSIEDAARTLGCGPGSAASRTSLAASVGAIASSGLLVATFCLTAFSTMLVLGGGRKTTLEVEIWIQATRLFRLDIASALAALQMVIVLVFMFLAAVVRSPDAARGGLAPADPVRRRPRGPSERGLVAASSALVLLSASVPLAALVGGAFRSNGSWTLDHVASLAHSVPGTSGVASPLESFALSAALAVVAAILTMFVAVPAAVVVARTGRVARLADQLLVLPLSASAAVIGFGWFLAYRSPPVDLRGSMWAVPAVQAAVCVPIVLRLLVPQLRVVRPDLSDAALVLGAGPWRRIRVTVWVPLRRAVFTGAAVGFVLALGEFGASAFWSRTGTPTVAQMIAGLLSRPGSDRQGTALALALLVGVSAVAVFTLPELVRVWLRLRSSRHIAARVPAT